MKGFYVTNDIEVYPDFVELEDCLNRHHNHAMGDHLPLEGITTEIAEGLCALCRGRLPLEKLNCPISRATLESLIDELEDRFNWDDCDHILQQTVEICEEMGLPVKAVVSWLLGHGGACDCEVLSNVARRYLTYDIAGTEED